MKSPESPTTTSQPDLPQSDARTSPQAHRQPRRLSGLFLALLIGLLLGVLIDRVIALNAGPSGIAIVAIATLYRIGPSRNAVRFPWVLPGAAVAALAWVGASYLFGWYVSTLTDYTATYGSLAAVVVFMTWLWLSVAIMLIGAELNAELEHQTARDTTQGPPKPLGARGAVVADNVGPAVADG